MKSINKISLFLLIVFVLLLSNLQVDAQKSKYNEEISEDLEKFAQERSKLIYTDFSDSSETEWAGNYTSVQGTTVSTRFIWSENSGFLAYWYNCSRPWTARVNYGLVEFSNNRLIIYPELSEKEKSSHIIDIEFIPIKWDEQHFLIPSNKLLNFAYTVHSNSETQIDQYFVKTDDRQKSREGLPDLPKEYETFLRMKAIEPKIKAFTNYDEDLFATEITLDLGRADKLIEGMIFYYSDDSGDLKILVTELNENTSRARIISSSDKADGEFKLKTGLKLTSKKPEDYFDY